MKHLVFTLMVIATFILTCYKTKISDEGFVQVNGGKVWYKIVGSTKKKTPVLLLHGGPGFPSDYLEPLGALASERPVIFYDQLGCGRSDKSEDTTLWNIKRFVDELSILRRELALDSIHLFAHSWGTMLAAEYISTHPVGIRSIVFASPIFSTKHHLQNVNALKMNLPTHVRDTLLFHEKNGTTKSDAYVKAYEEYLRIHWCRISPYPKEIQESFKLFGGSSFETMWGHYEFYCPGNLRDFERTHVLREINVPTLFTCGKYDLITPETARHYSSQVSGAEMVVFQNSAHMTINEEPNEFISVVRNFLKKIE